MSNEFLFNLEARIFSLINSDIPSHLKFRGFQKKNYLVNKIKHKLKFFISLTFMLIVNYKYS